MQTKQPGVIDFCFCFFKRILLISSNVPEKGIDQNVGNCNRKNVKLTEIYSVGAEWIEDKYCLIFIDFPTAPACLTYRFKLIQLEVHKKFHSSI